VHEMGSGLGAQRLRYQFCRRFAISLASLISLFVAAAGGCNERGRGQDVHESNLRLVAVLYSQYSSAHGGEAPRDAYDFRKFVQSLGPEVLERGGFAGLDELLMSGRDGKPFAIKYQSENWKLENAIAYEQLGVGGTRLVATELGGVSEITDDQFQERLSKVR
jgi:hypothetical protein